jgi:hypothetical protein
VPVREPHDPANVTPDFTAGGSLERVVFRCSRFWRFRYAKAGGDAQAGFVGETRVSVVEGQEAVRQALKENWRDPGEQTPSRLFRVTVEGSLHLLRPEAGVPVMAVLPPVGPAASRAEQHPPPVLNPWTCQPVLHDRHTPAGGLT